MRSNNYWLSHSSDIHCSSVGAWRLCVVSFGLYIWSWEIVDIIVLLMCTGYLLLSYYSFVPLRRSLISQQCICIKCQCHFASLHTSCFWTGFTESLLFQDGSRDRNTKWLLAGLFTSWASSSPLHSRHGPCLKETEKEIPIPLSSKFQRKWNNLVWVLSSVLSLSVRQHLSESQSLLVFEFLDSLWQKF